MIAERLKSIPGVSDHFKMLSKDELDAQFRDAELLLANLSSCPDADIRHFDGTDADAREMSDWLAAQRLGNEPISVFWLYHHEAATMTTHDFIDNVGDLWYPSSDDLLVVPLSKRYVLKIDHEEQVSLQFTKSRVGE